MLTAEEFILQHYGVKGMKWGKKKNPASSDAARSKTVRTTAKKKGVHTVSNKELQDAISRMQLEQNFKRLSINEQSAMKRWLTSTLTEMGKREIQTQLTKKRRTSGDGAGSGAAKTATAVRVATKLIGA